VIPVDAEAAAAAFFTDLLTEAFLSTLTLLCFLAIGMDAFLTTAAFDD